MKIAGFYEGQIVKTSLGCGRIRHMRPDGTSDITLVSGKEINQHLDFVEPVLRGVRHA